MVRSIYIWYRYTINSFQMVLLNRSAVVIFLTSKLLRIGLFLMFLVYLFQGANSLAGYDRNQIVFFYLSFNLVDTLAQLLFREVYRFRPMIVSGDFDLVLLKPLNPLVRVLLGGADVIDLMTLILLTAVTSWFGFNFVTVDFGRWIIYIWLIANGMFMVAAFHILVLALGVLTTTVDHLIMVYRDLTSLMRIPVDAYIEPIRWLLTFGLLLGMIFTFPAKALMGLLTWQMMTFSTGMAIISVSVAYQVWKWSLKCYTSASS